HLETLTPALVASAEQAVTQGTQGLEILHALFKHASDHFAAAQQAGISKDQLKEPGDMLRKLQSAISKLDELEVQNQKATEQGATAPPGVAAPPLPAAGAAPVPA